MFLSSYGPVKPIMDPDLGITAFSDQVAMSFSQKGRMSFLQGHPALDLAWLDPERVSCLRSGWPELPQLPQD